MILEAALTEQFRNYRGQRWCCGLSRVPTHPGASTVGNNARLDVRVSAAFEKQSHKIIGTTVDLEHPR